MQSKAKHSPLVLLLLDVQIYDLMPTPLVRAKHAHQIEDFPYQHHLWMLVLDVQIVDLIPLPSPNPEGFTEVKLSPLSPLVWA